MKNLVFLLFLFALVGCDLLEKIEDLRDTEVEEVAPVHTVLSITVVDYDTKELVDHDIKLLVHPYTASYTIDNSSIAVDSVHFTGGVYNLGVDNAVLPTTEHPVHVWLQLESDQYLKKEVSVLISDTGITHLDVPLFHLERLPANHGVVTYQAELDEDGNPLPIDFSLDTTLSTNGRSNTEIAPFNFFTSDNFHNAEWYLSDCSRFNGKPYQVVVTAKVWSEEPELMDFGYQRIGQYEYSKDPYLSFFEVSKLEIKTTSEGGLKRVSLVNYPEDSGAVFTGGYKVLAPNYNAKELFRIF